MAGFKLVAFPREFEKGIWESLDRRYYTILLASLAVVYGWVIYLANSEYNLEELSNQYKQRYVQRFYQAEFVQEAATTETETGPGFGETEQQKEEAVDQRALADAGKRSEERGVSASERMARRRAAAAARGRQRSSMEDEVGGTGVLAELTAGGGGGTGDAIYDVLGAEGGGVGNLDQVLGQVGGLQTASSSGQRSQLGARAGGGGGRGGTAGIDDLIEGGIGQSGSASISRQGKFSIKREGGGVTGKAAKASGRSADEIGRLVDKHADAIENCYKKQVALNPNLEGSISLQFTIDPDGKVTNVRILDSTLRNKNVENCITSRIQSWRFQPINAKEGSVTVRQKFIFTK
jgi:TonB family protein